MAVIKCNHLFLLSKSFLIISQGEIRTFDHHGNEVSLSRPFWLVCFKIFPVKVGGDFAPLLLSGIMRTYGRV